MSPGVTTVEEYWDAVPTWAREEVLIRINNDYAERKMAPPFKRDSRSKMRNSSLRELDREDRDIIYEHLSDFVEDEILGVYI